MRFHNRKIVLAIFLLAAAMLACSLFTQKEQNNSVPEISSSNQIQKDKFSSIQFAEFVSDYGELESPSRTFSGNISTVYAYFEYAGMSDGDHWGYTLTQDGYEYIDAGNEIWEDGREGWVAYYFEDLVPGEYKLTLFIDGIAIASSSFSIRGVSDNADTEPSSFGVIQFATGVTEDLIPIRPMSQFQYGITEVYAVFPYFNMTTGTEWRREWWRNGELEINRDLTWEEEVDGMDYTFFGYEGDEVLPPGDYELRLYINGQLSQNASFTVIGEQQVEENTSQGPANPEDIIDPNLMRAWEILAYANPEILRDVAQFALDHHVEIILEDIKAKGTYRCNTESHDPGKLFIDQDFWNKSSWEEVAATMAHELTHAVQHIEGGNCGCTIENEYYAYVTEFYVLQETGRMDLLETKWRGAYDDSGRFDSGKLWSAIKDAYPECPDY